MKEDKVLYKAAQKSKYFQEKIEKFQEGQYTNKANKKSQLQSDQKNKGLWEGIMLLFLGLLIKFIIFTKYSMMMNWEKLDGNKQFKQNQVKKQEGTSEISFKEHSQQNCDELKNHNINQIEDIRQLTNALTNQVRQMCLMDKDKKFQSSFDFQCQVISHPKITALIQKLKHTQAFSYPDKGNKDRKTSFFRLILKHLKKNLKQKKRKVPQDFKLYQKRLNMNSICSEMIQELFSKHRQRILNYLKSQKIRDDIIYKNKSKTNKLYYMLHLDSITYVAEKGKIHQFPFFQLDSLVEQVRRVIRDLRLKFIEQKMQSSEFSGQKDNIFEKVEEKQIKIQESLNFLLPITKFMIPPLSCIKKQTEEKI